MVKNFVRVSKILSNISQYKGKFLGLVVFCFVFFGAMANVQAADLPAPTLLVPNAGVFLGQDRVWVGGVAFNDSEISILVDGNEYIQTKIRNHKSGVGNFGVKLDNLSLGQHIITSLAKDRNNRTSIISNELVINIKPATPAPTLSRPIVNSESGIERPFVVGNVKNGLEVNIVVDNLLIATIKPVLNESGTANFAWQPSSNFSIGRHKIEAFSSDNGKLSNNSQPIYWQVGEVVDNTVNLSPETASEAISTAPIAPKDQENNVIVKDQPKAPDVSIKSDTENSPIESNEPSDSNGRVLTGEENKELAINKEDGVKELAAGAVVKITDDQPKSTFKFNNSLIIGFTILIFLIISLIIWYIQEKKERLGKTVIDLFREVEEKEEEKKKEDNLPPPPPPVF